MENERKRPTGLINNKKEEPKQTADTVASIKSPQKKVKQAVSKNQNVNIKISNQTKNELDVLIKLTNNKFSYEMIEALIDNYVDTALDSDQKRVFKTLSSINM